MQEKSPAALTPGMSEYPAMPGGTDLAGQVKGAFFWRSGSQIVAQAISWAVTLLVVRILDPSDYGLFAMTEVIMVFLTFLSGYGFASSLIQAEKVEPLQVRQAFGMLLLLNGALAIVQVAIAPLAADYFGQAEISDMLRWQALLYLATPFSVIPEVLLARGLKFKTPAIVGIISAALGAGCAAILAFNGAGVWTLVFTPIVIFWSRAILLVAATRILVVPSFNFKGAEAMLAYGSTLLASHFFWVIQSQADIFIAGRMFDPHALGLYAEALFLTQIFASRFVPPLNQVAFPAYAGMQNDKAKLAAAFLTAVRLVMLLALPLYFGLAVTANEAVATLFGPKWVDMAPLVSILSLAMPVMTLQILFPTALNAVGQPRVTARISLFGAILMPATFLVAAQFGPSGVAFGWLFAFPILAAFTYLQARHHLAITLSDLVQAMGPSFAAAAAMAAAVWLLKESLPQLPAPVALIILATAGIVCYGGLLRIAAPSRLDEVVRILIRRQAPA